MTQTYPAVRLRRLRQNGALREALAETTLEPRQMILPIFVVAGENVREPIKAFDDVFHWSVDRLPEIVSPAMEAGIRSFLLFGLPTYKDAEGSSAWDPAQPVQRALRFLREHYPQALLVSDVCLCQYTEHGHCGLLSEQGEIENDSTVERLAATAASHAEAGAHVVAPSDMMDGRVARIRERLDADGRPDVLVMSYAAKMQSAFYGPFREAAHSAPAFGDRRTYQMPPTNAREALREALADEAEGADILMVKPAITCLDIIARLRDATLLPIATYLVSGEYMMLKSAIARGALDEKKAMLEAHLACRRAGADLLVTYEAVRLAGWLAKSDR